LHSRSGHILCLSISYYLLVLGSSPSSERDSSLFIIIPWIFLLCLFVVRIAGCSVYYSLLYLSLLPSLHPLLFLSFTNNHISVYRLNESRPLMANHE
jgi:hypothetical protein